MGVDFFREKEAMHFRNFAKWVRQNNVVYANNVVTIAFYAKAVFVVDGIDEKFFEKGVPEFFKNRHR